jgi:hypothetical protein
LGTLFKRQEREVDLEKLPGAKRAAYIRDGRRFPSERTLAQQRKTSKAYEEYGPLLVEHGFDADDATELKEMGDLLVAAGVGREEAQDEKTALSSDYVKALRGGKAARKRSRSVLESALRRLNQSSEEAQTSAAKKVRVALLKTQRCGVKAGVLLSQIRRLSKVLALEPVALVTATRGGPAATLSLSTAEETLLDAAKKRVKKAGTPEQTEYLDLIDGVIVEYSRCARSAARSAADELGRNALADAFSLSELYARSSKRKKQDEGDEEELVEEEELVSDEELEDGEEEPDEGEPDEGS